jgi:hypothetical protein
MAVENWTSLAHEIGQRYAALVAEQPIVQALFASPDGDGIALWLVTAPADPAATRLLTACYTSLRQQLPETDIRLHILNRRNYPNVDPERVPPDGTILITRFAAPG